MKSNIDALIDLSSSVYSLPVIHARLNAKLKEPNASNAEIANIIENDPGLTLVVLKIVNSAIYGFRQTISTVNQAVTILGRNELSVLLFSTGIMKLFKKLPINDAVMNSHWRHSLLCGLIAKDLAMECDLATEGSTLFVAGLLHDMGKPIIWHNLPEQAKTLYTSAESNNLLERERSQLGFDHAEVGYELMKLWGLPDKLSASTLWHHEPETASHHQQHCQLIYLANLLANLDADGLINSIQQQSCEHTTLQFTEEVLAKSLNEASRQLVEMADFFGVKL